MRWWPKYHFKAAVSGGSCRAAAFTCDEPAEEEQRDERVPGGAEAAEGALTPVLRLLRTGQAC